MLVPGSEKIPFNPINPWGQKPVVRRKDGSIMNWKSPLAEPLFQVHVLDHKRGDLRIGPKIRRDIADQLCANVTIAIKAGKITGWSSPCVLPAV